MRRGSNPHGMPLGFWLAWLVSYVNRRWARRLAQATRQAVARREESG